MKDTEVVRAPEVVRATEVVRAPEVVRATDVVRVTEVVRVSKIVRLDCTEFQLPTWAENTGKSQRCSIMYRCNLLPSRPRRLVIF